MLTPFTCRSCHRRTYHEHLRHLPAEARLLLAIFNDRLCNRCTRIGVSLVFHGPDGRPDPDVPPLRPGVPWGTPRRVASAAKHCGRADRVGAGAAAPVKGLPRSALGPLRGAASRHP